MVLSSVSHRLTPACPHRIPPPSRISFPSLLMSSVAASAESIDSRCLNLSRPRSSSPTPVPPPMRHTGSSSPPCRLLCDRRLHIDLQRPLTHDREVDDSTDDHLRPEPLLHASTQACPQETPSSGLFISKEGQERSFTEKDMLFNATGPPQAWPGRAVAQLGRKSWDGPKPISFVGSTGSIGTQTLDIVAENPDKF